MQRSVLEKDQGATGIGATGLRGSERENLPLGGSLRGSLRGRVRGCQRFLEFLRGFRGFAESLPETLSECHFPLSAPGPVAPNRVAP